MKVFNFINNRFITIVAGSNLAYNLFDEGLAKFLCLETLRHGTSQLNYLSIYLNGANPKFGGGNKGSSVLSGASRYIKNSKNYFHVFKDTEFMKNSHTTNTLKLTLMQRFRKIILPRRHALLSGASTAINFNILDPKSTNLKKILTGSWFGLFTPTIKFRFTLDQVHKDMENDPDYYNCAYRTSKLIDLKHIGIIGTLSQGINLNMFARMTANPLKVINGIALMTLSYFVTSCFIFEATFYNQLINSSSFLYGIDKITKIALYGITILGAS